MCVIQVRELFSTVSSSSEYPVEASEFGTGSVESEATVAVSSAGSNTGATTLTSDTVSGHLLSTVSTSSEYPVEASEFGTGRVECEATVAISSAGSNTGATTVTSDTVSGHLLSTFGSAKVTYAI